MLGFFPRAAVIISFEFLFLLLKLGINVCWSKKFMFQIEAVVVGLRLLSFSMTFVLLLQGETVLLNWRKKGCCWFVWYKTGLERHKRAFYVVSAPFLFWEVKIHVLVFALLEGRWNQDLLACFWLDQELVGAVGQFLVKNGWQGCNLFDTYTGEVNLILALF